MPPAQILVVDDEPDVELLIRQRFRRQVREGLFDFTFAHDGVEALEKLRANDAIDIVLTDINMPRMDGLSLLGEIRKLERVLKVVIVSAYGDMENIRLAMNRGAFDFVTKPINFEDLQLTLDKTNEELELLREAVQLQKQFAVLQRELDIAREIQRSVLPAPSFERREVDLDALMQPAREVGGDFYDVFLIDEHRLGFAVGDVAGKGVGAALFMAITRTTLRACALRDLSVEEVLREVNAVLFPESPARMFATIVYGILDLYTGAVDYGVAGHLPPYVLSSEGSLRRLDRPRNLALCLVAEASYRAGRLTLAPGDTLFLYSDGVTEATDPLRQQFSDERLADCLRALGGHDAAGLVRHVLRAVDAFADGAPPSDDITLLALQYRGPKGLNARRPAFDV